MKKKIFWLVVLLIVLFFCLVSCNNSKMIDKTDSPLKEVNIVRDNYGRIIQQIFYDEQTSKYIMKEFTYSHKNGKTVCVDQKTTLIESSNEYNTVDSNSVTIYYNKDLADRPIIILDNEYARVTVKKFLAKDSWWEFGYDVEVVNKTDRVISVSFDSVYIMDIACKPMFSIDHIDAGKTANFILGWDRDTLERCYIPYVDNIEFMVRIYDNGNWSAPALAGSRVLFKS